MAFRLTLIQKNRLCKEFGVSVHPDKFLTKKTYKMLYCLRKPALSITDLQIKTV